MNVSFIFRTFHSIFEFLAAYETTLDPQKGQKKTQKSNETFEKWMKRSFYRQKKLSRERNVLLNWMEMNVENESFF